MQVETESARRAFEAIMAAKGKQNLQRKGDGYLNPNIQVKWRYMQLGWTLAKSGEAK